MKSIIVILALILSGCAVAPINTNYSLIDSQGVNYAQYERDYADCAALANQTDVANRAAGGAVAGAVFGAILGAMLCGRNCARSGAAGGALGGTTGAVTRGVREQQGALRACLSGRGYRIIR